MVRSVPVRGTQTLVDQIGWVLRRPSLPAIEIAWRWLFGIPFLLVCWSRLQHIAALIPPQSAGLTTIDKQNPWNAAIQLSNAWSRYEPAFKAELKWLVPVAALAWVVVSSFGRNLLLMRMQPGLRFRPLRFMPLQAAWLLLFGATIWGWFTCVSWAGSSHITADAEPELIGYSIWVIFLSLSFFTMWALVNWAASVSPLLALLEDAAPSTALARSLRLGKTLSGKLLEVSLVMGIVTLALIVLSMVISAAPLPFSDQLGPDAMHVVWECAVVFYLVASDIFQVVRLKSFLEFWRTFREQSN